jgi:AcrR family transcriptional regulator
MRDVIHTAASDSASPPKRVDARRNEAALLDAAAAAFSELGVDVAVRDIASRAGVGIGTIYRHFPTRADLVVAVYRHQVEACAEAGPSLLAAHASPYAALVKWVDLFVDFLVTKHGLAAALQSDAAAFQDLHTYFVERLVPVFAQIVHAGIRAAEIRSDVDPYELLRGIGNLCIGPSVNPRYDPRRIVELVIAGSRVPADSRD